MTAMQVKSILCPVHVSDFSSVANQHAVSLAEYYKAMIVTLHVVELWKYPFADYAAHEADYAKLWSAMKEGDEVQWQRFVKQYSATEFSRKSSFIKETLPTGFSPLLKNEQETEGVLGFHG